ncbi:MAG: hypothetical protein AB1762_08605 [Gemmatimonadota bacterium]
MLVLAGPLRLDQPTARNSHVLVSSRPNGGVLLIGGAASGAPRLTDTLWKWSGASW